MFARIRAGQQQAFSGLFGDQKKMVASHLKGNGFPCVPFNDWQLDLKLKTHIQAASNEYSSQPKAILND
jgi:hypothetical protein